MDNVFRDSTNTYQARLNNKNNLLQKIPEFKIPAPQIHQKQPLCIEVHEISDNSTITTNPLGNSNMFSHYNNLERGINNTNTNSLLASKSKSNFSEFDKENVQQNNYHNFFNNYNEEDLSKSTIDNIIKQQSKYSECSFGSEMNYLNSKTEESLLNKE